MDWAAVLENKSLQDLPFKIETNRFGQIVMSPASNRHGINQGKITTRLSLLGLRGTVITECSVETEDGVKVADVAWASAEFIQRNADFVAYPQAPEVCVEIVSPSNSRIEMQEKRDNYFCRGAKEVWLCDLNGTLTFYDPQGIIDHSKLFPEFPAQI
jgi:Uma2 family endonuclease